MEFLFELVFEIIIEGMFAGVYYLFNKFFKYKVSNKSAKIISGVLTVMLIVGAFVIVILIMNKLSE